MLPDVVLLIFLDCYVIQAEDGARSYTCVENAKMADPLYLGHHIA